jgi:imidazolonepropionase-like amidohydrolase
LLSGTAHAETIAITGGRLVIGDGTPPIDNGSVLLRDGRIAAAGANIAIPPSARIIDARGKWITPGLVAGFSRVGLAEIDGVGSTNDAAAAGSPFSAAIDVTPAINPRAAAIAVNRAGGITRALVAPGAARTLFAGQGAVIDLGADSEAITRPRAFQFVEFGEAASEIEGGSRAAAHVAFRNALLEARDYARNPGGYGGRSKDSLLMRLDAAALVPVVEGRTKLLVHVERASDILAVLDLKRDFPALDLVLVGATEGWTVAPRIAAAKVPVIATALADLPAAFETLAATQSNVGRMRAAGVMVALGMINDNDARQARLVKQYAGNLVALTRLPGAVGLDWNAAFASISSKPAEAIGLGQEIGSLRPGRLGDVVIWDGDPLELASAPITVIIDGIEQSLANRQSKLRDRYLTPEDMNLPKAYER